MKGNHRPLPKAPHIAFEKGGIQLVDALYHHPVLIEKDWHSVELSLQDIKSWINHDQRKNCLQIVTFPTVSPDPKLLDHFWAKNIPTELLTLPSAISLAKLMIAEQQAYQLLILPK